MNKSMTYYEWYIIFFYFVEISILIPNISMHRIPFYSYFKQT